MLNRVILIGRLTKDPELRYTPASVAVTQFTIACDRPFSSNGGEKEADFIPIVTWRQLAENCANHLKKGRLVAVEGRIQVRNYENNEGKRQYVTEVIADSVRFLDGNRSQTDTEGQTTQNSGTPMSENRTYAPTYANNDPFKDDGRPIDIAEDDLPF